MKAYTVSNTSLVKILLSLLICICFMVICIIHNLSIRNSRFHYQDPHRLMMPNSSQDGISACTACQQLIQLQTVLRPYIKEIEDTGKELLKAENAAPTKIKASMVEINALYEGYFSKINTIPSVRTIFFRKDFNTMKKLLIHDYFDYSSNNCEYLALKSKPSNPKALLQPKSEFHCVSKNESLQSQPLQKKHLSIGLPFKYQHQQQKETWTFMHVIQNAILTQSGFIRTSNVTIVPQQCDHPFEMNAEKWTSEIDSLPVYDEVLSITQHWGRGFYHFTHESAPRLAPYIELLNNNPRIKIFVHSPTDWPLLSSFGIKNFKERLIEEKQLRAKVLYSPAGGPCGKSPIFTTHLLSLYARQSLPDTQRHRVILIKRTHKRFFNHHNEIAKMLQTVCRQYGLVFYVFRDDPLPNSTETMKVFNEALIVVAPHGAGSSNMIYSQPGTVLIEGAHWSANGRINPCYRAAAHALGHIFYGVVNKYPSGVFDVTPAQVQDAVTFFLEHLIPQLATPLTHN